MMPECAIILAGGFGTRLSTVISAVPKPMAPVRGKPFLDFQLGWLQRFGITEVILSTGHLAHKISGHYGSTFGKLKLRYSEETEPLGTGGALLLAAKRFPYRHCLVLNGDSFFAINLTDFILKHNASGASCSLALREVEDASRYGRITVDDSDNIVRFEEKSHKHEMGLINGGVYLLDLEVVKDHSPKQTAFSIEKDFFAPNAGILPMKGFPFSDYFIDIGIPADYSKAQDEFERFED